MARTYEKCVQIADRLQRDVPQIDWVTVPPIGTIGLEGHFSLQDLRHVVQILEEEGFE